MNRVSAYIIGLSIVLAPLTASAAPMTAIQFDALTGISSRWENPANRKLLEERLRLSHTNMQTKEFFEKPYSANLRDIGQLSSAVVCQKKEDVNRCKGTVDKNLQR